MTDITEQRQAELRRGAEPGTPDELSWVIFESMRRYVYRETSFTKLEKAMTAALTAVKEFNHSVVVPLEEEARLREWR